MNAPLQSTVVLLALSLGACHLLLPFDSRDTRDNDDAAIDLAAAPQDAASSDLSVAHKDAAPSDLVAAREDAATRDLRPELGLDQRAPDNCPVNNKPCSEACGSSTNWRCEQAPGPGLASVCACGLGGPCGSGTTCFDPIVISVCLNGHCMSV